MEDNSWILYLLLVLLLAISAFFSTAETAISTVNKLRLRKKAEEGNKKAGTALKLTENFDKTLYTILIGNNLVNIMSSTIATVAFTALLGSSSGPVVSTVVMTIAILTFGEILPKSYGNDNSDSVSLFVASPLQAISVALTPLTWFFMKLKNLVSKSASDSPTVTEDELIYMLGSIEKEGVIEEQERDLVQSALEFDETRIREVITPRVDVVALDVNDTQQEILKTLLEEGYSRVPVYEGSIDTVIGVLYSRDYLRSVIEGGNTDLRSMLAEPCHVHRSMKLSRLFSTMKEKKVNMVIVTDDYGGTSGIITMADLLEELVGDLWDEDEEADESIIVREDGVMEIPGSSELEELLEFLGGDDYELSSDYTTVNGWAGHIFGHIPQVGEQVVYKDLELTVQAVEGHRIDTLLIRRLLHSDSDSSIEQTEAGEED